jgi:hypothetical protein
MFYSCEIKDREREREREGEREKLVYKEGIYIWFY